MDEDLEERISIQENVADRIHRVEWRSLFNFTRRRHITTLIIAFILSIISGAIVPTVSIFAGKLFSAITEFGGGQINGPELVSQVSIQCIALVALGGATWVLNGGYFMFWLVFGELQAQSARDKLFGGLMDKEMAWYDLRTDGIGALIPRLQSQIRELQMATSQPLGFLVQYCVTAVVALGVAFYNCWNLTLVTLASLPIAILVLSLISGTMQPSIDAQVDELAQATRIAGTAISAIETVKCCNCQEHEVLQFRGAIRRAAKFYRQQARANALQIGVVRLIILGMFVQGFWYGSTLLKPGGKTAGQILTSFWATLMATQTVEQILPQTIVLETGKAAAAVLHGLVREMERERRDSVDGGRKIPGPCIGDIELKDVTFSYPARSREIALESANLFFPAGETTFVVGKSGSGKSTIGNLLMRFYPNWSGNISIDGHDLRAMDLNWLRNNVTLVQQMSVLFDDTLMRNLTFGCKNRQNVTKAEVKRACEAALLLHTINDLPHGLDTMVGVGGKAMSGGQRQRIAIARARLRDTPILILDESTSALDYVSRALVMDSVREWRRGKTTIIITHEISQVFKDDYVYVLDQGKVLQEGYRGVLEQTDRGPFSIIANTTLSTSPQGHNKSHPVSRPKRVRAVSIDALSSINYSRPLSRKISQSSREPVDRTSRVISNQARLSSIHQPALDSSLRRRSPANWPLINALYQFYQSQSPHSGVELLEMDERVELGKRPVSERMAYRTSMYDLDCPTSSSPPLVPPTPTSPAKLINESTEPESVKQEISSLKTILVTVWPNLSWKSRSVLLLGSWFALLHAAATPLFSYLFAKLLGTFFVEHDRAKLALKWSLSVLGVAVGDAVASYLMHYLLECSGQAWVDKLRVGALHRILDQPRSWFDEEENSLSRLNGCLDRNAEEMRNLVGRFAGFVFVAAAMTTIAIVWSFIICWKITIVALASAPAMYLIMRGFQYISGQWESKSNEAGETAESIFTETFTSIRTVRALTLENYFRRKHQRATAQVLKVGLKRSAYSGLFYGISESGIHFITALIFYYGSSLASTQQYSTQSVLTVLTMLIFSIANAHSIIIFIPQINSSRSTATSLLRLSSLPSTSHELLGRRQILTPLPVQLTSLDFAYPSAPTHPILSSLTLAIPPSTSLALVGPSGCGKSTLAALLLRLHAPNSSPTSLTFSSHPHTTLSTSSLRNSIAYVPQTPFLLPTTIAANIAYGLPPSFHTDSTSPNPHPLIAWAATQAGIHDWICSLPQAYHTPLVDTTSLSGGQAQRLALARALARRPTLLVLDEATSALDQDAARAIRDLVRGLVSDSTNPRTVVIVTHDREWMRAVDQVAVFEAGRVVEVGSWEALMSGRGGVGGLRRLLGEEL